MGAVTKPLCATACCYPVGSRETLPSAAPFDMEGACPTNLMSQLSVEGVRLRNSTDRDGMAAYDWGIGTCRLVALTIAARNARLTRQHTRRAKR